MRRKFGLVAAAPVLLARPSRGGYLGVLEGKKGRYLKNQVSKNGDIWVLSLV
jgi:hypothetical protein